MSYLSSHITLSSPRSHPDTALYLIGHGSEKVPQANESLITLAKNLEHRNLFESVTCGFWRGGDPLTLDSITASKILIIPLFAGQDYLAGQLIPQHLGLIPGYNRKAHQEIYCCQALGSHLSWPEILRQETLTLASHSGMKPKETSLFLVAHGSRRHASGQTAEKIKQGIESLSPFKEIFLTFIEQSPYFYDWPSLVTTQSFIVQPLLISRAGHFYDDIMPALQNNRDYHSVVGSGLAEIPIALDLILDIAHEALNRS
jgi:sirohydrochlorin cobaltochelatase